MIPAYCTNNKYKVSPVTTMNQLHMLLYTNDDDDDDVVSHRNDV